MRENCGVYSGEQGTVEPSPPLRNESRKESTHDRRYIPRLGNTHSATEVGTSVDAFALFT